MSTPELQNETKWVRTAQISKGSITPQIARQSTLHLEMGEFRLRFFCEYQNECIWLEDYTSDVFLSNEAVLENLRLLAFDHPVLSITSWKAITILLNSEVFTLIPEELFRKEYTSRYLQLTMGHPVLPGYKPLFQHLKKMDSVCIFQIPQSWWDFFQDHFALQQINYVHIAGALIEGCRLHMEPVEQPQLFLYFQEGYFFAAAFERAKLILCNRFRFKIPEEATFFVLSSLNGLSILPEGVIVHLSGEITPFSGTYGEMSRFLPYLKFCRKPTSLLYPDAFEDLPDHRYFVLLNSVNL